MPGHREAGLVEPFGSYRLAASSEKNGTTKNSSNQSPPGSSSRYAVSRRAALGACGGREPHWLAEG